MICAPYYCFHSLADDPAKVDTHGYKDLTCKSLEFFRLWYLYTRHFFPEEHVYLVDCAGPIPLERALPLIDEPVDLLPCGCALLNPGVRFHVKRFTTRLPHYEGSARTTLDYLRVCATNERDMLAIETDALVGYDLRADIVDRDFVTQRITRFENRPIAGTIHEGAITYVSYGHIDRAIRNGSLAPYTSGQNTDLHESALYDLFAYGRTGEWSWPQDYVHKAKRRQIARFLRDHPLDGHPEVAAMAERLERDIAENPTWQEAEESRDEMNAAIQWMRSLGRDRDAIYGYILSTHAQ